MAKQQNWLVIGALVIGLAILGGYIAIPTGAIGGTPTIPGQPPVGPSTGSAQNPSIQVSLLDGSTNTVKNQGILTLMKDGLFSQTATTAAGVATFSNLTSNKDYVIEVTNSGGTAFYPFSFPVKTANAGSVDAPLKYKSIMNTAPTITGYNFDNITSNAMATRQAIAANDSGTFRIRYRTASAVSTDFNVFGDGALPLVFVVDYNTLWTQSITMKGPDGVELQATDTPSGHTITDSNLSTNGSSKAFKANLSTTNPATDYDFYVTVNSNTTNPSQGGVVECMLRVITYDSTRYQNRTGAYVEGYRNVDTQADLGATNYTTPVYCS